MSIKQFAILSVGITLSMGLVSYTPKSVGDRYNGYREFVQPQSHPPKKKRNWERIVSSNGIEVFTRDQLESPYKEIKATLELDCSLNTFIGVITDYPNYKNWIYATGASDLVEKVSDLEYTMYQLIKTPWPTDDRDVCMRVKISQDEATGKVTIINKSEPKLKPVNKGVVRVNRSDIKWEVLPTGKNKLKCNYFLNTEPGGSVPAWLINLFIAEGPYQSLYNLKAQQVKKAKYLVFKNPQINEKF